ncbi:RadC family protein [Porphyromonas pogonae]|uniref:RadC family protein n=1 Tax=Porphyromonas pogonae TaxID=867595 RepID=UPI002E76A3A7|nr:DNA repair protein RadC [Porphyromonas pogonae]
MKKLSIKQLAEDDRPREKLLRHGSRSLSDAELLAIILGSGNSEVSAVGLSQQILSGAGNNWNILSRSSVQDLVKNYRGVGPAKAISIIATMEIARRMPADKLPERVQIDCSSKAYKYIYPHVADLPHEELWILLLNQSGRLIEMKRVGQGGVSETVADVRIIMKYCIDSLCSSIIMAHNHPSGEVNPSQNDRDLTRRVNEACKIMGIRLNDHLIIGNQKYLSFADEGIL